MVMNRFAAYTIIPGFRILLPLLLLSVCIALVGGDYLWMAVVPGLLILLLALQSPSAMFFLLLATIPLSAEIMLTQDLGTDFPDELLMWLLSLIIPLLIILKPSVLGSASRHPLMILLLCGLCWTVITVLYSTHILLSVKFLLAKCWYIIPFCLGTVLFLKEKKSVMVAAGCLVLPMLFATVFIVSRHAFTGFSFEQVNDVARPLFRNHVNYAALLVCTIPISFALYKNAVRFRLLWLFISLFFLAALFLSYSRGAWLAFAAAIITMAFVKRRRLSWMIISVSIMIIGTGYWFAVNNRYLDYRPVYEQTIYHSSFDEHIEATYSMRDLSTAERFYRWIAAVRMSKERPLTGYGPNSFYHEYKPYAVNSFSTYVSENRERSTVHNYFLLLLTEQGLPGLVLFIALFLAMMFYAQHIYHRSRDTWEKGLMMVVLSLLSMTGALIFLSDLMETDKIGSIFFICLGILISRKAPDNTQVSV
jgi:O-antigen ligase